VLQNLQFCNTHFLFSGNYHCFDAEAFGKQLECFGVMPDAERKVMSRSFHAPFFQEGTHIGRKFSVGVGIAGRRDRVVKGFTFGNDEFKFAVGFDSDA